MAILKRTIIFEDDLVNSTATLNLSSGEVKSIIFKNKTIEFFLNFNVDKATFDEKRDLKIILKSVKKFLINYYRLTLRL
jgi:hypothetical protein